LRIRLVKKLAAFLNGIDLSERQVGDVFDCDTRVGRMLIRERWAFLVESPSRPTPSPDIGILWKDGDGTVCVLTRRDGVLLLSMQRAGFVEKEERVESAHAAMTLAARWRED
jgi:hypothetical protein